MKPSRLSDARSVFVSPKAFHKEIREKATLEERLACAVVDLRESLWDEIVQTAESWNVPPERLVEGSRRCK